MFALISNFALMVVACALVSTEVYAMLVRVEYARKQPGAFSEKARLAGLGCKLSPRCCIPILGRDFLANQALRQTF